MTGEEFTELSYMMNLFGAYLRQHDQLITALAKDKHNIPNQSLLQKVTSNLNSMEPVIHKGQKQAAEYLSTKHDIIIQV